MKWDDDGEWYVNPSYDKVYHPTYNPEFTFPAWPGSGYQSFKVDWGDGVVSGGYSTADENKLSHLYTQAGVFDLKLLLYSGADVSGIPNETFNKKVMNRSLEASFRLSPSGSRRCMEWGGDSVKFILTSHDNPPGTEYKILVNSDIEKLPGKTGKKLFSTTWIDGKADSAWIVALEPTGIYGARVGVSLTWSKNGVVLSSIPGQLDVFWAYQSPNLKDIYHFADTLAVGQELSNFFLCIPADAPSIWLDTNVLAQYQYRSESNPLLTPYYKHPSDRLSFNVEYFWTDSTPTEKTRWIPVTGKPEYVDTTAAVLFKKTGFYKMRMEAYNQCGYDITDPTKLLYVDTLWTDSLKGSPQKRYFQVTEQAGDNIVCRKDSACVGNPNQVVIVDRNSLKRHDEFPNYKFTIKELSKDADYKSFSTNIKAYKDGKALVGGIAEHGCDSTEIILTLRDTGDYAVELKRECHACDPVTVNFKVYVGDAPKLFAGSATNPIEDELFGRYDFGMDDKYVYQKCDSFRYALQEGLWSERNFAMDSIYFYMQKGTTWRDTILNYAQLFYEFDSVGNVLNSIKATAHNYCGWGQEASAEFYTRTRPKVVLLRDSLPLNDTLCVDFDYNYYLGGVLPEKVALQAKFSRQTYVNGGVFLEDKLTDVSGYAGGKIKVRHPVAGETIEYFKVINQSMSTCFEEYKDTVYLIAPPDSLIYRDSVRYCATLRN